VIDPVCGMTVEPASAAARIDHAGHRYYFCSRHCAQAFTADPQRYLTGTHKPAMPAPAATGDGAKYACPMHPEIVRDDPGSCPKCGMALVPMAGA